MMQRYWLRSIDSKGLTSFPNSEFIFFTEVGSRGAGVRFASVRVRTQLYVKALKCWLSVSKASQYPKTVGRQAQKQPSFKESVTAHPPRLLAAKIIGAKTNCRYVEIFSVRKNLCKQVRGWLRSLYVSTSGAFRDMDPCISSNDRGVRITSAERARVSQRLS